MRSPMLALPLALGLGACQTVEEKYLEAQAQPRTPLTHDPTHDAALAPWWSNGAQMLRLDRPEWNGAYAIHSDTNRYHAPIEVGRWRKESYALLWLNPYDAIERQPVRVAIDRVNGELAVIVPGFAPMFALDGPPEVLEDRVMGHWHGPMGHLALGDGLWYHFSPARREAPSGGGGGGGVAVAGHDGSWSIVNDVLVLQPKLPGSDLMLIPVKVVEGSITLDGPGGALTRAEAGTQSGEVTSGTPQAPP